MEDTRKNDAFGWQDNVIMCSERLSRVLEERFQIEIGATKTFIDAANLVREDRIDAMQFSVEALLEYMFGTAVALGSHYVGTTPEFEEVLVNIIRDKMQRLRKISSQEKPDAIN